MFERILEKAINLQEGGKHEDATAVFDAVLGRAPDNPYALYCAGTSFLIRGMNGVSMSLLSSAIQLSKPEDSWYAPAWNNFATALKREEHQELAVKAFEKSLEAHNDPATLANYSGMYINQGTPDRAIELSRKCMEIDPYQAQAGNHYSLAQLEMGNYEEGFRWYNSRLRLAEFHDRKYPGPMWEGERVGTLVVHGEQGVGDEIMFCSQIPEVLKRVDRLVIECAGKLIPTFARSFGVRCYATDKELLENEKPDAWIAMGSLPGLFKAYQPLEHQGYLKADPVRVEHWRAQYPGLRIGVSWRGGTKQTHFNLRNFDLKTWKKLTSAGRLISLQYGEGWDHEIQALGLANPKWNDFDDHMALVAACDLVISVCNTTVHMAGALNVPCWVLVPSKPAWRYGMTGERMLWYPSARMYRQIGNDWDTVIEKIRSDLEQTYQSRIPPGQRGDARPEAELRNHGTALRLIRSATG